MLWGEGRRAVREEERMEGCEGKGGLGRRACWGL